MLRRLALALGPLCACYSGSIDDGTTPGTTGEATTTTTTTSSGTTTGASTGAPGPTTGIVDVPLALEFATPMADAVVSGIVKVDLKASASVEWVELLVDGAPLGEDDTVPFGFQWDCRETHDNPLPPTTHAFDFGYYFVDGRYGDYRADVAGYTNLYYAWAWRNYPTDQPWGPPFSESLANAEAEDRAIHLNLQEPAYYDEALDRAAPHWGSVRRIEAADEPPWTLDETEAVLADIRARLDDRGLAHPPIGIVYTHDQVLGEDALFAAGLDWVGIEAYVDPPGDPDPAVNAAALTAYVEQAKARVPADKDLVIIMQAYDRNGGWTDIDTLTALQPVAYELAYADPRVLALTMFSYGRPGGSLDHPELAVRHKQMGERILGRTVGSLSDGPHTLTARGHGKGDVVEVELAVVVDNL